MEGIKLQKSIEQLHNKLDVIYERLRYVYDGDLPPCEGVEIRRTFNELTKPIEPPKLDPNWKATDQYGKQKAEEIKRRIEEREKDVCGACNTHIEPEEQLNHRCA